MCGLLPRSPPRFTSAEDSLQTLSPQCITFYGLSEIGGPGSNFLIKRAAIEFCRLSFWSDHSQRALTYSVVRFVRSPLKAQLVDSIRRGDWIYEIKFDGYRALALRGGRETRILSRNQKDLGKKFPEITSSIAALGVQDVVIDGEIVALDDRGRPSFQLLQGYDMGLVPAANSVLRIRFASAKWRRSPRLTNRRAKGETGRALEKLVVVCPVLGFVHPEY
jgi:hypothetical protein